jgi:hypothetical protein
VSTFAALIPTQSIFDRRLPVHSTGVNGSSVQFRWMKASTQEGAMLEPRKIILFQETTFSEMGRAAAKPIVRVAAAAVLPNPFAGQFIEDLSQLFDAGGALGEQLMEMLMPLLHAPVVSYGKAAVVGTSGEFEHGGALLHPKLGKPMRAAIGGGKAVIPSNVKVGSAGSSIDVPLGQKDEPWSFDHFDTMTVSVADAPRPDEIVMFIALADGGRIHPRCRNSPLST